MDDMVLNQIEAGIKRVMADPVLKSELAGWTRTVALKVERNYYTIHVEKNSINVSPGKTRGVEVEIRLDKPTFIDIVTGKMSLSAAYLRGFLKFKGEVMASDITRLQKLL